MGFFSGLFPSSTRTDVNTTVARVIPDKDLPDSVTAGSIKAFFNEGNISDYVLEEMSNSLGLKADRMYKFGEKKYIHGLPSGEFYFQGTQQNAVQETLNRLYGSGVVIEYSNFGPANMLHFAWEKFLGEYNYHRSDNEIRALTATKGASVYLDDLVVVVPAVQVKLITTAAYSQFGTPPNAGPSPSRPASDLSGLRVHSPIEVSDTADKVFARLKFSWVAEISYLPEGATVPLTKKEVKSDFIDLELPTFEKDADYFQIMFTHNGQQNILTYKDGEGSYPLLDKAFDASKEKVGEFYPFAYFRYKKQAMNKDKDSQTYKDSKKLLNYLNMDFDTVADAIHENPGIADVEQAMLIMAVSADSKDQMGCRYLFDFFNRMYYALPAQFVYTNQLDLNTPLATPSVNGNAITIKDKQFELALSNGGIVKQRKMGVLGKIGTCTSEVSTKKFAIAIGYNEDGTPVETYITQPVHIYRRQMTAYVYDEVQVLDLQLKYFIWENYTVIGDDKENILLVPIDKEITKNYSIRDKERLYAQSLHFVFNSVAHTTVQWYESGVFKTFLIVVAIAFTVYTGGSDGGQAIAAALGLSGTAALIAVVIIDVVLTGMVLRAAYKLFVKVFGADVAAVLAVAAVVYGGYEIIKAGGVSGAPWSQTLLDISTGLYQAVLESNMNDLLESAKQFGMYAEEQQKLLDEANKLLDNQTILSPFVLFGESPDDFYNRTIHSGNIGILGIDAITSYVDVALALPELSETLGGNENVV